MQKIGLIGVGYIGKIFLNELLDADYTVTVFDTDNAKIKYATNRGASAADSPANVGSESDIILMAVPGTPEVEATIEGDDGLLAGVGGGELIIDATTTHPETSVVCEQMCTETGVSFVEATITGGAPREGYHMMAGGTKERYEQASDILDIICDDHKRIGPIPHGTIFKLGLQMRYAGHHAIDAEIVEFVRDNGVDPHFYNNFLGLDIWEQYFTGNFSQEIEGLGGLTIWAKDIGYAREFAHKNRTALPINGVIYEAYKATVRQSDDDEGHAAALIKYWLALNDTKDRYDV